MPIKLTLVTKPNGTPWVRPKIQKESAKTHVLTAKIHKLAADIAEAEAAIDAATFQAMLPQVKKCI